MMPRSVSVRRQIASTFAIVAALTALSGGFATSSAAFEARPDALGLSGSAYPETGPPTTTTLPVPIDPSPYPTVPPTTTAPPFVPDPGTTNPSPTLPPTTRPPAQPTPTAPPTTTTTTLPTQALHRYGVAQEHERMTLDVSYDGAASHTLITRRDGIEVSRAGLLTWTPGEDDGSTIMNLSLIARSPDGSSRNIEVQILVTETNSPPTIHPGAVPLAYPNHTVEFPLQASDPDTPGPQEIALWTVDGPSGMSVDGRGVVTWVVPDDAEPGFVEFAVSATDSGQPAMTTTATLQIEVVDVSDAALMAVDSNGDPVNPLVIAPGPTPHNGGRPAEPFMVDLAAPADLMIALVERTPGARVESAVVVERIDAPFERSAVVTSVQQTLGVLLDLEVPKTAVAGGLAWQFALMFAPALVSRRKDLFDVNGLPADAMIGDGRWFFRSDAIALRAGGRRWRDGQWMRRVVSPAGPVWLPSAHLQPSHKTK